MALEYLRWVQGENILLSIAKHPGSIVVTGFCGDYPDSIKWRNRNWRKNRFAPAGSCCYEVGADRLRVLRNESKTIDLPKNEEFYISEIVFKPLPKPNQG